MMRRPGRTINALHMIRDNVPVAFSVKVIKYKPSPRNAKNMKIDYLVNTNSEIL